MKRSEHTFQFKSSDIAVAAKNEALYHEKRVKHWQERADSSLEKVKATVSAKVVEMQVTSGKQASLVVDHGDPAAWQEYQLSFGKIHSHRGSAERFRIDQKVYETQGNRVYELDTEDIRHFRLGGEPRED